MLRNTDGTPYKLGDLKLYDPCKPDYELMNKWDEEIIERSGSPIYYYEIFINVSSIDPLYREARDKLFSPNPIEFHAIYEPISSQFYQDEFGIGSPDEVVFECNKSSVLNKINHFPKPGSRIFSPHRRENWEIIQCKTGDFHYWSEFRLSILCKRYQESITTQNGQVTREDPEVSL